MVILMALSAIVTAGNTSSCYECKLFMRLSFQKLESKHGETSWRNYRKYILLKRQTTQEHSLIRHVF